MYSAGDAMTDKLRTDALMSDMSEGWPDRWAKSHEQLERELAEAQAEVVRLKGEAERWEKVFDRTFVHARKLEREIAEAQAEITRLKGEAESWEKVFDRTCQLLADAKTEIAAMKEGK